MPGRDLLQERDDLVQGVLLSFWELNWSNLLLWKPGGGRSLESFVWMLVEREVISLLRRRGINPWTEDPVDELPAGGAALSDAASESYSPESFALTQEACAFIERAVAEKHGAQGVLMYTLLFVEPRDTEEICMITEKSRDAVFAWRHRLLDLIKTVLRSLSDPPPPPRKA